MSILIIVNNTSSWPLHIPGVQVVSARAYLTDPIYSQLRRAKIFNLCRSYRYQTIGYYVSLLAEARGHKPQPNIATVQDLKMQTLTRLYSEELAELVQRSLSHIRSEEFELHIYFGRTMAKSYERLSRELFKLFHAPLLRAGFSWEKGRWQLTSIDAISASEIPESHQQFVVEAATQYFAHRRWSQPKKRATPRYELAILYDPLEREKPSDDKAIKRFMKAAQTLGIRAEIIGKEDYADLAEFDALFIRQTTSVNHHTYRFARRAEAEGLVVIDDPLSILRCTNKVYLAELLDHHGVRTPRTRIVHRDNIEAVYQELGGPLIVKQPDSSFSLGVMKAEDFDTFESIVERMLDRSDLLIAQEFLPTAFDWRVGVFEGQPLYVCKYFMARKHWQVVQRHASGKLNEGAHQTLSIEQAPRQVVATAVKAANLMGNGLYGVDLKQIGNRTYVIEVNDNPNIDVGVEDAVLKDRLYLTIIEGFIRRIERQKASNPGIERLGNTASM